MADVKQKVALSSIGASAGLTAAKAIVGVITGSLGLLSEAAHSLIDVGATVMTYFAVRTSGKPADAEHHYGHGKVESVTALIETALLFVLAGVVSWEAIKRLMSAQPPEVEATPWAFAVIAVSIVVDFLRARVLYRTAEKTSSDALAADALHFASDMWSSLAVLVGLLGIALGYTWADSVAAIAVSVVICIAGWRLSRRTIDTLTDTAPPGAADKISAAIKHVPGVVAIERLRDTLAEGGSGKQATTAIVNLAESLQGLIHHMRTEQQMIRDWVDAQSEQHRDIRKLLEILVHETQKI